MLRSRPDRRTLAVAFLVMTCWATVALSGPAGAQAGGVSVPGCSTAVATAPLLTQVPVQFVPAGSPFGVVVSPDGRHVVVAAFGASGLGPELIVYRLRVSTLTQQAIYQGFGGQEFFGLALSPNGGTILAAGGSGAAVFDARRVVSGRSPSSWRTGTLRSAGQGGIEAAISPDGRYGFVSLESSAEMAVFRLAEGRRPSALVGYVPLGLAPVGIAVAPSGRYLYVTSEQARGPSSKGGQGTLTTVDLKKAETSPAHSVVSTVAAGCSPVRVVATGTSVYVTARESDQVLAFSASDLVRDPRVALQHDVEVGEAPVGLAVVDGGRALAVADSDRFDLPGATSSVAIVDLGPHGAMTLRGYVQAEYFPRDMAVTPDGHTLIVSNNGAGQVEVVDVAAIE